MSAPFIIRDEDREAIIEARDRARLTPITRAMLEGFATKTTAADAPTAPTGERPPDAPEPQQVPLPFGWRLAISAEEQPFGMALHISMSSPTPLKTVARPEAMNMVLDVLGLKSVVTVWVEDYKGPDSEIEGRAVNMLVEDTHGFHRET